MNRSKVSIPEVEFLSLLRRTTTMKRETRCRFWFQFQKWNSSACSRRSLPLAIGQNLLLVSIPEVEFLSLLPTTIPMTPARAWESFQFQKWNSSACSGV